MEVHSNLQIFQSELVKREPSLIIENQFVQLIAFLVIASHKSRTGFCNHNF